MGKDASNNHRARVSADISKADFRTSVNGTNDSKATVIKTCGHILSASENIKQNLTKVERDKFTVQLHSGTLSLVS